MHDLPNNMKQKFEQIFGLSINEFENKLIEKELGVFIFDIFKFEDFLVKQGYNKNDGSMASFVTNRYGIEAKKLIEDILFFSIQKQNEKL